MRLIWILMTLFFCIFYPTVLAKRWCYGQNWKEVHIKNKAQYWRIFFISMLPFAFLCFVIGSDIGVDDTIDNIIYYYRLGDGGEEYLSCDGWAREKAIQKSEYREKYEKSRYKTELDPDDYVFHLYYTRKLVNEDFILKIAKDKYTEVYPDIELVKTDEKHWAVRSGEEILGYVESQGGFFLKKIVFLMYRGKIHVTKKLEPPKEIWSSEEEKQEFYEYVESQWRKPTVEAQETKASLHRKNVTKLIFFIILICTYFITYKKTKIAKNNQIKNQEQNNAGCQPPIPGENDEPNGQAYTSEQWKPQAHIDEAAEQAKWNEANPKWNPDEQHTSHQKWNPQDTNLENGQWKQTPVWKEKDNTH